MKKIHVFLGGTCNGSSWRKVFIEMLDKEKVSYFDPVVDDWNEEAYQRELKEREECDFCLYVITPKMTGVYSIAEVIDDSNKRPEKTVFCYLLNDEKESFSNGQEKSLKAVAKMVAKNGGLCFTSLKEIADYFNKKKYSYIQKKFK